jgi:SAM-dependent methyltransferase
LRLVTVTLFRAGQFFARAARVFNHLAAGTLRIRELRVGIERTWEEFSARDADIAAGLMQWEEELITRFVTHDDRVLLVGAGPGRDLIPLVARGYRVTAIEPARRAIATARRHLEMRGLSADIIEGFFEDVALPDCFDVIIFSGCCYNFIPDSRRRIAALRKAAAHLSAQGRIIVSYLSDPSGHPLLMQLARIAARVSGSDWRPERGDVVHLVHTSEPLFHYEHPFRAGEIDVEVSEAGLQVVYRRDVPDVPVVVLMTARGDDVARNARLPDGS